jgi:hypothetical protein
MGILVSKTTTFPLVRKMEKQLCAFRNSRIALRPALRTTTRSFCMAPPPVTTCTPPPGPPLPPTGLFPLGPAAPAKEPGNDSGGPTDPMKVFGFIVVESLELSDDHDQANGTKVVGWVSFVVLDVSCT